MSFRWIPPFGSRYDESKARRPRHTTKLHLEGLEDRTMPSVLPNAPVFDAAPSPAPSVAILASPSPAPSVAVVISDVVSALEQDSQLLTAFQQDVSRDMQVIDREIAQVVLYVGQLWDSRFGIQFNASNSVSTTPAPQPRSGSGGDSGATTTGHDTSHQPLNNSTEQTGRGLGSGSSATTTHGNNPVVDMHPLTSDSGSDSDINPMPATVYGYVWLDNNGDGVINNGETALPGVAVNLYDVTTGMNQVGSAVSDANGNYNISLSYGGIPGNQYEVGVDFSTFDYATIMGSDSDIYPSGFSPQFTLGPGTNVNIPVGIRSMTVTTLDDDPNGIIPQQITLRDAIETGNNGPPSDAIAFINPLNNQPLTGTITLQAALPDIYGSYDIDGPGDSILTVQGPGGGTSPMTTTTTASPLVPAPPFRIFTIRSGAHGIGGLSIRGGSETAGNGGNGGGIYNAAILYLNNDEIDHNTATSFQQGLGNGGGIYNAAGATLVLNNSLVADNTASGYGGGIDNLGTFTSYTSQIIATNSAKYGGGIANQGSGAITELLKDTEVGGGVASSKGGGIYITGGTVKATGSLRASIHGNSAATGGGIYVGGGKLTLDVYTLVGNTATTGNGGGMYIAGGNVTVSSASNISDNSADKASGGGIYNLSPALTLNRVTIGSSNSAINGGGMYLANGSTTTFGGVLVNGNTVTGKGKGIAYEKGAIMNPQPLGPPALTDNDDQNGPVQV